MITVINKLPFFVAIFVICSASLRGQSTISFPSENGWNKLYENDTLNFRLAIDGSFSEHYRFNISGANDLSISFDSLGNFLWVPSTNLVDRVTLQKSFHMIFEAIDTFNTKIRKEIEFIVMHKNRPPVVDELPTFYIRQYSVNSIDINKLKIISDPDGDPIVFKPILSEIPEGATLSENGIFSWRPTRNQFRNVKKKATNVKFIVQDQPSKAENIGVLRIMPTQQDLPPDLIIVPADTLIELKEDEVLNLNFYVSDPNGDDNIEHVDFVTNESRIAKSSLKQNASTQYEFNWTPGYDFSPQDETVEIEMLFYAIDKANKRSEKKITLRVKDTENIRKKDERLYKRYFNMLVQVMDLVDQLDGNQKELNKLLVKARKGKKNRSILNASLGAVTGISPVFLSNEPQNIVTGIGGTTVLTIGTLEATDVIGTSKDDILQKIKTNIDIRNQLQANGDQFARQYALKQQRYERSFHADLDKLKAQLNNQKLILLELDASWENKRKPTPKNVTKTFPDFNNEGFEKVD